MVAIVVTPNRPATATIAASITSSLRSRKRSHNSTQRNHPPARRSGGWRELEGVAVCGANDAEVSAVQGGDPCRAEAFSDRDQAGVGSAEGQVLVAVDELSDALPIGCGEGLDGEGAVDDRVVERRFGVCAEFSGEQVDRFGNDHRGGDQWPGRGFEELKAGLVVAVGAIGGSDEWAGVNDQHWSVATKPVGEEFVDLVADAVLARSDRGKAEMPATWRSFDVGHVIGEDFGGEFLDRDPARSCGCFQAASDVVGNVHGHRHGPKPMRSAGDWERTEAWLSCRVTEARSRQPARNAP